MQESRENAERKQEEGEWAKPRPNKNPLEKTGAAHGIGQGGELISRFMHPAAANISQQLHRAASGCTWLPCTAVACLLFLLHLCDAVV